MSISTSSNRARSGRNAHAPGVNAGLVTYPNRAFGRNVKIVGDADFGGEIRQDGRPVGLSNAGILTQPIQDWSALGGLANITESNRPYFIDISMPHAEVAAMRVGVSTSQAGGSFAVAIYDSSGKRVLYTGKLATDSAGWQAIAFPAPITVLNGQHSLGWIVDPSGAFRATGATLNATLQNDINLAIPKTVTRYTALAPSLNGDMPEAYDKDLVSSTNLGIWPLVIFDLV